jgi:histidine ammonia-lyase
MIVQYTAAALVSHNKQLAVPCVTDSIPSSNGQEDHVSMGANGANRLIPLLDNLEQILAIEWLVANRALIMRDKDPGLLLRDKTRAYLDSVSLPVGDAVWSEILDLTRTWLHENFPDS